MVRNAIQKYVDGLIALAVCEHKVALPGTATSQRFALIYISPYPGGPAVARVDGQDKNDQKGHVTRFREGDILARIGAQTKRSRSNVALAVGPGRTAPNLT